MAPTTLSHSSIGPDFRSISRQPPSDPDIQATLSDFLTYTEHFPSHLTRALTLIRDQRIRSERSIKAIHDGATAYSTLPSIQVDRPDPVKLRRDISYALEEAFRASSMALEEATRLDEECAREGRRLGTVLEKLKAQPVPPTRDPSPEQQTIGSPDVKRERRSSTRVDEGRAEKQSRRMHDKAVTKLRGRKVMVPGEVLPPPDPNAPLESMSDWTTPRNSPPLEEPPATEKRSEVPLRARSRTPKPSRPLVERQKTPKSRGPRAPGQPGTNAHSAVAGISTSNALLALTKPPDDAVKGSKWLPWLKLTEWEMAKLRKRMKKNAIWVPSQTMVRRELKNLGRGVAGKEAAKARAESSGDTFVDEQNEPDPTKYLLSGEESDQINPAPGSSNIEDDDDADAELINRGMRLNEAKKLKRQRLLEEQALQAQIAREQGVDLPADAGGRKTASMSPDAQKKRKRESTPGSAPTSVTLNDQHDSLSRNGNGPQPKKFKLTVPGSIPNISKVPLAPAGGIPSSSFRAIASRSRRAATPQETRQPSVTLKIGNKAVSEEPPSRRESLRRASNASMPGGTLSLSATVNPSLPTMATTAATTTTATNTALTTTTARRSKRPAPGIVQSNDGESAKVGYSRRKAAPRKRGALGSSGSSSGGGGGGPGSGKRDSAGGPDALTDTGDEDVDPDEPRYCLCGDVSWGTMIACDNNDDCEREWFHLDCVQLDGMPPRRTKWYCPDCRKKLRMGQTSNGLVGRYLGPPSGR